MSSDSSNAFENHLAGVDLNALRHFLSSQTSSCYESRLMRLVFPEMSISQADALAIYQHHFVLFHALYRLQKEYYIDDKYLHVHFMRIQLFDYPQTGRCRFFSDDDMQFCNQYTQTDLYCDGHDKVVGEMFPDQLSDRYFYLDPQNYDRLDKDTAESFMNGTWQILSQFEKYRKAFEALDIPVASDPGTIRKAFWKLARQYHPDRNPDCPVDQDRLDRFLEINNAYQFLMHVNSLFLQK